MFQKNREVLPPPPNSTRAHFFAGQIFAQKFVFFFKIFPEEMPLLLNLCSPEYFLRSLFIFYRIRNFEINNSQRRFSEWLSEDFCL